MSLSANVFNKNDSHIGMKKKTKIFPRMERIVRDGIEDIQVKLHEINEKLDHLIRNLRRYNGSYDHPHHTMSNYLD